MVIPHLQVDLIKLKDFLKQKKISQERLSNAMNISTRSIVKKLNGESDFKLKELNDICFLLNIPITEILVY